MKKILLIALMPLLLIMGNFDGNDARAQSVSVDIGDGTSSNNMFPFNNFYKNSYNQMVYYKSEVGSAGYIGAITFKKDGTAAKSFQEITIWMANISDSVMTSSSWVPQDSLKQVYHATDYQVPSTSGDLMIVLDSAFYHDGNRHLAIVVSRRDNSYNSMVKFFYTSKTGSCIYRRSDGDPSYAQHPGSSTGTVSSYRPNITLTKNTVNDFCFPVVASSISVDGVTENSIDISWSAGPGSSNFEVAILDTLTEGTDLALATVTAATGSSHSFSGLNANTTYKIAVRKSCTSGYSEWSSIIVTTTVMPVTIPFNCDFESDDDRMAWEFDNGSVANQWAIDTAVHHGELSQYSMYITSDDSLHTYEYNIGSSSIVFAKCLLQFSSAVEYNVGFDWKAMGEGSSDYIRVGLVSPMYIDMLRSGTILPTGMNSTSAPDYFIPLDGGEKLNMSADWQTHRTVVNISTAGNYYLVFMWRNDGSVGTQPPAAIDNIVVEEATCFGVDSVTVDNITGTSATITGHSLSGSNFILCYKEWGADRYDTLTIVSPYTLDNLRPGTYYGGVLRSTCGENGDSYSSTEFQFGTECTTISLPWAYGAESTFMQRGGSERYPYCWDVINGGSTGDCWKNNSSSNRIHSGEMAIYYDGSSSTSNTHDDWLFTPTITFTGNEEISFWVKTTSTNTGNNYHGRFALYASNSTATGIRDTANYDLLTITGDNVINNVIDFVGDEWQKITVTLPNTLTGDHNLAFVVKDFTSYMFCLDDIYLYTASSCATPDSVQLSNISSNSASLTWVGSAPSYTVSYGIPGAVDAASTVDVTTNSVELTDLSPNTTYEFKVTAICAGNVASVPSYPIQFTTTCEPIAVEALPLFEDFEDNPTGSLYALDDCWNKGTNYSTRYPYVASVTVDGERTNALYFYSNTSSYSYVALPAIAGEISNLQLSCRVRRYTSANYNSDLSLGLMTNPYDINTFTPFDTLSPTELGKWSEFQLSLSSFDENSGNYIAFLLPAGQMGYAHLDNLMVYPRGECDSPTDPIVLSTTATTATVSWSDTNANQWVVYYGVPGFSMDTVSNPISVVDTHAVEITGLAAQTTYEFVVVADCGGANYSNPTLPIQFTTSCLPIATLPYVEDFESYSTGSSASIDPCWNKFAIGTTTQYPYPSSIAATVGSTGLYFRSYESTTAKYNCYATLPMFTEPLNNLKIKFDMKNDIGTGAYYNYYGRLALGVMSNPGNLATFDTLVVFDMSDLPDGTVQTNEYMFDNYTGEGGYIALLAVDVSRGGKNYGENTVYVDEIEVNRIPTCRRPTQFAATTTATTADLTWTGNAASYEVMYSLNEDMSNSSTITTTTNSAQLTGLSSYTYYYVNVRGICSATDTSEWMFAPSRIRTEMDCGAGYQNLTSTIGDGTNKSNYYVVNGSSSYKNCHNWMIYTAEELSEMGIVGYNNLIRSISLQVEDAGSPLPLRIYMAETHVNEFNTNITDTMPLSQMTLVYDDTVQFVADSWNEIMLTTPFNYSDTLNLMIAFERNDVISSSTYFYYTVYDKYLTAQIYRNASSGSPMDYRRKYRANMSFNVCGELPSCVRPRYVAITSLTDNAISFSWEGTAASYQIAYGDYDYNPNTATPSELTTVTGTTATIQNLNSNTTYYFYLRSVCGSENSIWTRPIIVTTPCAPFDLPYSENFDSYPASTSVNSGQVMDPCWTKGTNSPTLYPHLTTAQNPPSSPNCLRFYGAPAYYSYVALPMLNEPVNNINMTFAIRKTSENHGTLYLGVMTDPSDITTFQKVTTVQPNEINVWENKEVSFASYTGTGKYIALYMPDSISSNAYVDNIEVFPIPTCPSPINIEVPSATITANTAVVQWTDRASAPSGGYQLEYGLHGFALGTGTRVSSTTNPTTLTNLQVGTCYDVYVRAMCSATDEGRWSYSTMFCTDCGPIALPVTYNFENFEADDEVVPHCFNHYNDATSIYNQDYPYIDQDIDDSHSGSKHLYFYNGSYSAYADNTAMLFPEIDTINYPMNGNQIVFWGKSGVSPSKILVGVMSDPANFSTFTVMDTVELTPEYTEYTVSLAGYTGTGVYPTFASYRPTLSTYSYIDDVTIEPLPVCPRAYDLRAVSATSNSATLAWNDTIGTTQWVLDYRQADNETYQTITVNSNPYTLTGLSPITKYYFNVRPICASGDTTEAVRYDASFWTTQVPATIPYTYDFEDAAEWNNWQTNSNCAINWYRGTALASQGTHSMYISKDQGANDGSNWLTTVNAVAYRDIDFGTDTSSFTLTFKANVGGTIEHNYDGVSVLLVDPTEDVTSSDNNITTPWGHINDVSRLTVRRDTTWGTHMVHFERIAGVHRVAFYWFNQSTGDNNPYINQAGAIDEISITEQTCLRPYNLSATNIEATSATLNWAGTAPEFEVAYCIEGDSVVNSQIVQGNSVPIQNLVANTDYLFQVRAICTAGDTSYWSNIKGFTTICHRYAAIDTIREDFTSWPAVSYSSTEGVLPDCWEGYSNGTNGVLPHVVGEGIYWYAHDGKSLIMTSGSTNYGDESVVRLPYTIEPVNCLEVSFWMCTESKTNGYLEVGYLTGPNLSADFVAIKKIDASEATYQDGSGNQAAGVGIYDTVSFDTVPANAQAIAFRWYYNTSFYSVCLDDIVVTANITCPAPVVTNTVVDYQSATFTWDGTATDYQMLYKEMTATDWSDTIAITGNTHTLTGLTPETAYNVMLRALCGAENGNSFWVNADFTTTDLPCFTPTNLATTEIDYEAVTLDWEANENAQRWVVNVFNTTTNILDTVQAHPATIEGLLSGLEYKASVKSICSDLITSDWSDTITFTTKICPVVTGVTISNITENSAKVTWYAGGEESQWQINYGLQDFGQGEGEMAESTTTTYTITGLEAETAYDVYVRAMCTEDFSSVWSEVVRFTTLESHEGIDGVEGNFQCTIYPNPTSASTTISLQGVEGNVAISIVDMNGRTLISESIECGVDCEKRLDVAGLAQGTYFVRILGNDINSVRKLIVR